MKLRTKLFSLLLCSILFPSALFAANWISISAMTFVGDKNILMHKMEGISSYLTLETTTGSAWAAVNFPPNTKGKKVVRLEALVYDGLDVLFGELPLDVAHIGVLLNKVDLATGETFDVMAAGTAYDGAPGLIIVTDTNGSNTEIDNKKWAWYLKCYIELSSSSQKDHMRLYGVRIRYK